MLASVPIIVITKLLARKGTIPDVIWPSITSYFGGYFEKNMNERNSYKIITFITLFCGNFVWMCYQASLTVDLSSPTTKLPFNNLETFAQTNWKIYTTSK